MILRIKKGAAKLPRLPYAAVSQKVLPKKYELSLAYLPPSAMEALNTRFRGKTKPTNVLAFPISKSSGEILLCPSVIKKEAPRFGRSFKSHLATLFIHGILHLRGYRHGSKMERSESKVRRAFGLE